MTAVREANDRIYLDSLELLSGVVKFTEVDPDDEVPPPEWVKAHGREKADRMLRAAKLGHVPQKDAPIGLRIALEVTKVERKVRSEESAPKSLNVNVVQLPQVSAFFPEKEIIDVE